jgi:hypothetical protein
MSNHCHFLAITALKTGFQGNQFIKGSVSLFSRFYDQAAGDML